MSTISETGQKGARRWLPDLPLAIWMIVAALAMGLAGGLGAQDVVHVFNAGWGRALGEFALILIPSFILASALARQNVGEASGLAVAASPLAGAGMVCPDTAYAALSPVAGKRRLSVAFGSYAGFKLLFPAGPLIVATGLGVESNSLMIYGLALVLPVWALGVWWVRFYGPRGQQDEEARTDSGASSSGENSGQLLRALAPFGALAALLIIGALVDFSSLPLVDFLTRPKGALLFAAVWGLWNVVPEQRRDCLDYAVRRTGSLLFVIGAASAFGAVLIKVIPIADFIPAQAGIPGIIGLFILTACFKLLQGSSMATFAAVAPVAAPIVAASSLPPAEAVFAICLGSFVAILPNDSFYWLVRKDALATGTDGSSITLLAGGATVQALGGFAILLAFMVLGG